MSSKNISTITDLPARSERTSYVEGNLSDWNRFTDLLGFTNRAGSLGSQWDMLQNERDYNSPAAQAERLREAGINPDINGDISSPESTGAPEMAAQNPETLSPADFANGVISIFTGVTGILSGVIDLRSLTLSQDAVALNSLGVADEFAGASADALAGSFVKQKGADVVEKFLSGQMSDEEYAEFLAEGQDSLSASNKVDSYSPFSFIKDKRLRSALDKRFNQRLSGAQNQKDFYDLISSTYASVYGAAYNQKAFEHSQDEVSVDDVVTTVMEATVTAMERSRMFEALAGRNQNEFTSQYFHDLSPESAAAAENASYGASKSASDIAKSMDDFKKELFKEADKLVKQGKEDKAKKVRGSQLEILGGYALKLLFMQSVGAMSMPSVNLPGIHKTNQVFNQQDYSTNYTTRTNNRYGGNNYNQ